VVYGAAEVCAAAEVGAEVAAEGEVEAAVVAACAAEEEAAAACVVAEEEEEACAVEDGAEGERAGRDAAASGHQAAGSGTATDAPLRRSAGLPRLPELRRSVAEGKPHRAARSTC